MDLIDAALHMRYSTAHVPDTITISTGKTEPDDIQPLSEEEYIAEALRVGVEIKDRAIYGNRGGATWITRSADMSTGRYSPGPMGPTLYDGRCGIVVFVSALAHLTGNQEMAEHVAEELAQRSGYPKERIWLREIGVVLATHTGPGVIGVLAVPSQPTD